LSDFWPHGEVAECYGVLRKEGYTERAIFVIDSKGIIRYIDIHAIGNQPSNEELYAVLRKIDPQAAAAAPEIPAAEPDLPHGGIVMYCTPWCVDCRKARAWLDEKGLKYTEVDVSRSGKAARQVRAWANGNQVTPTFDIDGTIVVDFDVKRLSEILKV
jgi:glutaredoxin